MFYVLGKDCIIDYELLINGLLGPTMAYPTLMKNGTRVYMGNKSENKKEKKRA